MAKKSDLLLDDDQLLVVQTKLAIIIGDRRAIALQQIHYWMGINEKAKKTDHLIDGAWWVYNTWREWRKQNFPFWSVSTIRRVFADLELEALIVTRAHDNQHSGQWVTINYGRLEEMLGAFEQAQRPTVRRKGAAQIEQGGLLKLNTPPAQNEQGTGNTENNTETKQNDSAPQADAGNLPVKKQRERDVLFDAVQVHIFGIPLEERANGGRVAKISNWLNGKYEGKGAQHVGRISKPADPAHVEKFAAWCKREGFTPPLDVVKFSEQWRKFAAAAQRQPAHSAPIPSAAPIVPLTPEEVERRRREAKSVRAEILGGGE